MNSEPNIRVNVDPTNPGQFFACCGLLELADRLWPGAEGWFEDGSFCIGCAGNTKLLIQAVADSKIDSSLTDTQLARLGTLLSANKHTLSQADVQEKIALKKLWKNECIIIKSRFSLSIDWWKDEESNSSYLKTWAAKQFVLNIVRGLQKSIKEFPWGDLSLVGCLDQVMSSTALPLYFDSATAGQSSSIDVGFSFDELKSVITGSSSIKPCAELLGFIGLQRFRPRVDSKSKIVTYHTWHSHLPANIAFAAVSEDIGVQRSSYKFEILYRSQYMKAFRSATCISNGENS